MTEKEFLKFLKANEKKLQHLRGKVWPRKAGVFAINIFNDNFRKGGFLLDKSRTKWARTKRQDRKPPTTASKYLPLQSKRQHLMSSKFRAMQYVLCPQQRFDLHFVPFLGDERSSKLSF